MSQLSGIVSLFLIAAAFLTSCDDQNATQEKSSRLIVQIIR